MRIVSVFMMLGAAGYLRATAEEPLFPTLSASQETFHFVINADPQIGPADSPHANERYLHRLLADFVNEVNDMNPLPAFVVFNGDLVAFPREHYFRDFRDTVKHLKVPVVLVNGNHDGRHPDVQFLDVQESLSGFRRPWYAFTCGLWHFIVLPCPEFLPKDQFGGEMMAWLNNELKEHRDRPVMVFLHYHLLPVGLTQCEYYTLPFPLKTQLIDTLTRYGNVRYVISGHVHAGIQSSIKSSWHYKGVNFIVAPSPVEPRNFGEEYPEFSGEGVKNKGYYLTVEITQDRAVLIGRKINYSRRKEYPQAFPEFSPEVDARALHLVSHLQPNATLINGDFSKGLQGWRMPHRYKAEANPSYEVRIVSDSVPAKNHPSLYLFVREKGHAWAYDEIMELYQMVQVPPNAAPVIEGYFYAPPETKSYFGGAYIRLTGYHADTPACTFLFHWGAREARVRHLPQVWSYHDFGYAQGIKQSHLRAEKGEILSWALPDYSHRRHHLTVDLAYLYDSTHNVPGKFATLSIDKLLLTLGVWCGMEPGAFSGAYFDTFSIEFSPVGKAQINGHNLPMTSDVFRFPYGGWYTAGYDK